MTTQSRRQAVIDKYAGIIGRNLYSQSLRDYCYKAYKDGNYYSDCSSSICLTYEAVGPGFGNLNTAGIYQSKKLTTVDADIAQGYVQAPARGHAAVCRHGCQQAKADRPRGDVLWQRHHLRPRFRQAIL